MPTTYYHTLNGQILSEQTGGTRTEYVHDALGSVIATTDADRNVENTYRWAGYGTQVAKTGAGLDPNFQWAGTLGYPATGRPHAGSYIRARHYGVEQAGWTSVDAFWSSEGPNLYGRASPTGQTDFSGTQTNKSPISWTNVATNPASLPATDTESPCLAADESLQWVAPNNKVNGILMQQVTRNLTGSPCSGAPPGWKCNFSGSVVATNPTICEYWEVRGNLICAGSCSNELKYLKGLQRPLLTDAENALAHDHYQVIQDTHCCNGSYTANGDARFLPGVTSSQLTAFNYTGGGYGAPSISGPCPSSLFGTSAAEKVVKSPTGRSVWRMPGNWCDTNIPATP